MAAAIFITIGYATAVGQRRPLMSPHLKSATRLVSMPAAAHHAAGRSAQRSRCHALRPPLPLRLAYTFMMARPRHHHGCTHGLIADAMR